MAEGVASRTAPVLSLSDTAWDARRLQADCPSKEQVLATPRAERWAQWDLGRCDGDPCVLDDCGDSANENDVPCCVKRLSEVDAVNAEPIVVNAGGPACHCKEDEKCRDRGHHTDFCYIPHTESCTDGVRGIWGAWSEKACQGPPPAPPPPHPDGNWRRCGNYKDYCSCAGIIRFGNHQAGRWTERTVKASSLKCTAKHFGGEDKWPAGYGQNHCECLEPSYLGCFADSADGVRDLPDQQSALEGSWTDWYRNECLVLPAGTL